MTKGRLIVIEGSDGSGKATQAALLYESLKAKGEKVRLITFPNYQSPSSELVKMYLSGKFGETVGKTNLYAVSTFYAVDRYSSYELDWKEFYASGGIVISDRYTTSNMMHQGARAEESGLSVREYVEWLQDLEYEKYGIPRPDLVLFLDVPPEVSFSLMEDRLNKFTNEHKKDIHERDHSFLLRSYATANEIVALDGWARIPCTSNGFMLSRDAIAKEIERTMMNLKS